MKRWLVVLGALSLIGPPPSMMNPARTRRPGIEELSRAALEASAAPGLRGGATPVYRMLDGGFPEVSEAGFVQLADEGAAFYYAARTEDRIAWTRERGILGTNHFGDAEAMVLVGRIVDAWHRLHPGIRIGIDEISGRYGGFPDYDGDGISDHLTHQLGLNVNLSVPCRVRPEKTIHLGIRNDAFFERELFTDLVDLVAEGGAREITTHRSLLATGAEELPLASRFAWSVTDRQGSYAVAYRRSGAPPQLLLLNPRGDHSDHLNALLCKPE